MSEEFTFFLLAIAGVCAAIFCIHKRQARKTSIPYQYRVGAVLVNTYSSKLGRKDSACARAGEEFQIMEIRDGMARVICIAGLDSNGNPMMYDTWLDKITLQGMFDIVRYAELP